MNISKKDALASDTRKNIVQLGHSEENKTDELERENSFLSKKSHKEINPDDIVDTRSVTDMSETIYRDHSEECEVKKNKICDDLKGTDSGTDTDMSENNSRDEAKHHDRHRTLHSLRKGHDDLSIDTVNDLDSNVTKKII